MSNMPVSIKKVSPGLLKAEWTDGFSATIKIEKLRSECPCADCREKDNDTGKFVMPTIKMGKNDLKSLQPVGNYAVNPTWGDGHDTGIYPWEFFRVIFENYKMTDDEIIEFENKHKNKPDIPGLNVRSN
jgi:DUF971 family protein